MKQFWLSLVGLALVALACGPTSGPVPAGSGDTGEPKYGGTFNMRVSPDPFNWDISYSKSTPNDNGIALANDRLLNFKMGPDYEYTHSELQPGLAERWEVSPDAKTFTFHLRQRAKFQNLPPVNGREVTSADVKFTAEYRLRTGEFKEKNLPQGEVDYMFEGLQRVDTPDKYTAVFHFKDPFSPFVNYAASQWNPIMPREVYDQEGHFKDTMIGAGPFMLDPAASQKGSRWIFKKHPDYWDAGKPYVDEVRWLVIVDSSTSYAAFQTRQLDFLWEILSVDAQEVTNANPQAIREKTLKPIAQQLYLSQASEWNGPFQDARVRKALALATDRDEINKLLMGGEGEWGLAGAIRGLFTDAEIKQLYKYDLSQARRLLAEAGYPSGGVKIVWPRPTGTEREDIALSELLQAQWKKAGFDMELRFVEKSEQRANKRKGIFDVEIGSTGFHDDPDSLQYGRYHSKSKQNYGKFKDSELDRMLAASRAESNAEKRREIMRNISSRIVEQTYTVELLYTPQYWFWQPYVKNFRPNFYNQQSDWRFVWLEK